MATASQRREREKSKRRKASASDWADKQEQGFEPTAIKLPSGASLFKIKQTGTTRLDVIPFVAGKSNPDADEGFQHFQRTYYAHWVPGLNNRNSAYCCTAETFKGSNKRCPVCDWIARNRQTADQDLLNSIKVKTRMLWNVIDLNEKAKGIQIWDTAYWRSFGEMLKDAIKVSSKYSHFDDPVEGMTVQLSIKENKSGFGKFEIARVDLVPRDDQYDEDIVDKAYCLDECLLMADYDEITAMLDQGPAPERNGKAKPEQARDTRKSRDDENEDDDDDDIDSEIDDEDDEPAPKKKRKAVPIEDEDDDEPTPKKKKKPDPDDDDLDDDDSSPIEEEDDEDDEPTPKRKKVKPDPDDDDDDDSSPIEEEEDDEPAPVKRGRGRPPKER